MQTFSLKHKRLRLYTSKGHALHLESAQTRRSHKESFHDPCRRLEGVRPQPKTTNVSHNIHTHQKGMRFILNLLTSTVVT